METSELIKKVRKIEIKTKGLSSHLFAGEYNSAFKGRGMSFSEVREYQYGDDVRSIDWNVTARTGDPHIKIFEEERELTVMLLVDVSGSSFFGTAEQMKNEILTEICAVIAFSALNNNDKVGVLLFSDEVEMFIPPKKGKKHILRIIRELLDFQPKRTKTNLEEALKYFNNVIKKKSICFLLSDFVSADYKNALNIAARKHDLIGIHLYDAMEAALPNVGLIQVKDSETGKNLWVDTASKVVRKMYRHKFDQHKKDTESNFKKSGADIIHMQANESYINVLYKFFKKRIK